MANQPSADRRVFILRQNCRSMFGSAVDTILSESKEVKCLGYAQRGHTYISCVNTYIS